MVFPVMVRMALLNYSRMPMAMCSPGAAVSGIGGKFLTLRY